MTYFTSNGIGISLNGNRIAGFPDFMCMSRLGYRTQTSGIALNLRMVGSFRSDNFDEDLMTDQALINDLRNSFSGYYADNLVDEYMVFGLDADHVIQSMGGPFQALRLRMSITNLFDTLYASGAEGREFFPGQRRMFILGAELEF
jgi:outer membrane receptor protein involved in Fe transport